MDTLKHLTECSCNVNLGVKKLSTHDLLNSEEIERKRKLVNKAIHFYCACDSTEKCKIVDKIDKLREKIGKSYFERDNKLIAIPNQIILPKNPVILNPDEKDAYEQNLTDIYLDGYCEDLLHQSLIKTLRRMNTHALVYKGF